MKSFIGKQAFDFTVSAVLADGTLDKKFNFYSFIDNKNALLFFYPMDFTFVCPSELISISNRISEFKSRDVEVVCMSVDSCHSHKAWRNTSVEEGGLGADFSCVLASDIKKDIGNYYEILDNDNGVSYRATFIIDKFKIIRAQHINDFFLGRNIDEYIRLFDAISFHNEYGHVCQAGWTRGSSGIIPSENGIKSFLKSNYKKL